MLRPLLEEALRTQVVGGPPAVPDTRFALASALWRGPEHRVRATSLVEEARLELQRASASRAQVASVDDWIKAHAADLVRSSLGAGSLRSRRRRSA